MERINPSADNFSKIKVKMEKYEKPLNAFYKKLRD